MCLGKIFHKWTKWKKVGHRYYPDNDYICDVLERECEVCGWIQRKEGCQSPGQINSNSTIW